MPATAVAAPAWRTPIKLVSRGQLDGPVVAAHPGAPAAVVWGQRLAGTCGADGCNRIRAARATAAGAFPQIETLSADSSDSIAPAASMSPQGELTVVWRRAVPGDTCCISALEAAVQAPGAKFATPVKLTSENADLMSFQVAGGSDGTVAVVWEERSREPDAPVRLLVATRSPGAAFGPGVEVARPSAAGAVAVALAPDGGTLVMWSDENAAPSQSRGTLFASSRAPGQAFGAPETVATLPPPTAVEPGSYSDVRAAWTPGGERVAAWVMRPAGCFYCVATAVQAAVAPAAGAFGTPQDLSSDEFDSQLGLDVRDDGAATLVWARSSADRTGSDGVATDIRLARRPAGGPFRAAVSVTRAQVESTGPGLARLGEVDYVGWLQPDGDGPDALLGTYRPDEPKARITLPIGPTAGRASDLTIGSRGNDLVAAWLAGTDTSLEQNLLVAVGPDDRSVPRLTQLAVSPSTVRRGRKLAVKFRLSERALVTLVVRRSGSSKRLLTRTAAASSGRGKLTLPARALAKLRPGGYVARLRAVDPAGQASAAGKAGFRIEEAR